MNESIKPAESEKPQKETRMRSVGFGPVVLGVFGAFTAATLLISIESTITGRRSGEVTLAGALAGYGGTWAGLIPAIAWSAGSFKGLRSVLGFEFRRSDIPWGVMLGLIGQFVLVFLVYLPVSRIWPDVYERVGDPAEKLTSAVTGWRIIPIAISVGLIAPVLEELFFRGVVLRAAAMKWGPIVAALSSALLFGLIHFQPLQTAALSAFGLLLAFTVLRTNRLGAAIIAHITFNTVTLIILFST